MLVFSIFFLGTDLPITRTVRWKEIRIQIDTVCFYMSLFWEGSPLNQTCDPDWERFGNTQILRLNFGVVETLHV